MQFLIFATPNFYELFLQNFLEDLEEDEQMREKINIYRDSKKQKAAVDSDDVEVDLPPGPSLQEMLDDLDLDADVEMAG